MVYHGEKDLNWEGSPSAFLLIIIYLLYLMYIRYLTDYATLTGQCSSSVPLLMSSVHVVKLEHQGVLEANQTRY